MEAPVKQDEFTTFDTLWSARKFREARQLLYDMNSGRRGRLDALYWAKRASAEIWFNQLDEADKCMLEARACRDYSQQATRLEIDFTRDLAAWYVKRRRTWLPPVVARYADGKADVLDALLEKSLASDDKNDQAVAHTMIGRWFASQAEITYALARRSNLESAIRAFEQAEAIWTSMTDGQNDQWRTNNRFHWFMALRAHGALRGARHDYVTQQQLYDLITKHDPSEKRVWLVNFLNLNRPTALFVARRLKRLR